MIMNNPLELWKLLQGEARSESEKLQALAAMADAPEEGFEAKALLPTENKIPAFRLGNGDIGSDLAGFDYGVAAPVFGQTSMPSELTIGQMLIGED